MGLEAVKTAGADLPIKSATITGAQVAATVTLVAAVAGKRIIVHSLEMSTSAAMRMVAVHGTADTAGKRIGGGYLDTNAGLIKSMGDYALKNSAAILENEVVSVIFGGAGNVEVTALYSEQ